jgi:tRNA-2-methylthio-N6-dimethylallyladenosine synthase
VKSIYKSIECGVILNYLIKTIGCQMNEYDSKWLIAELSTYGASKVNNPLDANVFILNTCSVRSQAEQKAFSYLGRIEKFKQKFSNIKIVVIGCMAERLKFDIKKRFKNVDLIIGAKDIGTAALKIINLGQMSNTKKKENFDIKSDITRYVTIMRGCNNYCSYCIVPFVRGREKSFDPEMIINECFFIVKNGAREITLLGQNVNSYRYKNIDFVSLVKKIAKIDDLERIRFMTNHPKDLNDDLINIMATESKLCTHIHLPMQTASDKILKAMNRRYTYEYYLKLIRKLRYAIPNISVTTDIIVGFPGETDEDFEETLNAIKTIKFNSLYAYKYSPRPNTKAFEIIDNVSLDEKKRRHMAILIESNKISSEFSSKIVGSLQQVLIERIKDENNVLEAKTKGGCKVFIRNGKKEDLGKCFNVNINKIETNLLFGDIV